MVSGRPQPYRVVIRDRHDSTTTLLVQLDRAPGPGDPVVLPHGETVTVAQLLLGSDPEVAGVIIASTD